MEIEVLKSKIHRAVITEANLNYVGSLTLDEDLMEAANLIENEKITMFNILFYFSCSVIYKSRLITLFR